MAESDKKTNYAYIALRLILMSLFTGGFIYQTLEFLFLYWTYPTVVDIQESSPTYLDVPAFTFCNRVGYHFENFCTHFKFNPCISGAGLGKMIGEVVCQQYPAACENGTLPKGFKGILHPKFMTKTALRQEDIPSLAIPLEEYLNCTIEFAGKTTPCDMENVLGSFYAPEDLPQFCYTMYSKWGNPNKTRAKIPKGAIMRFKMYLNSTRRQQPPEAKITKKYLKPLMNPPTDMAVQIAVHSPFFLPSPYFQGSAFQNGRKYEIRINLKETHLLQAPYQTNCTDYMTSWYQRGGKGPVDQLTTIQECRINKTQEILGCIPLKMDYPHKFNFCKNCQEDDDKCQWVEPPNNCSLLADNYNQPCDSMIYEITKENKVITVMEKSTSKWAGKADALRRTMAQYDCEGEKVFSDECATIEIDIPFDRFMISNLTYNAKYESLELFSVVGGYMGMWLGISLLTFFDMASRAIVMLRNMIIKRRRRHLRVQKEIVDPNIPRIERNEKSLITTTFHIG